MDLKRSSGASILHIITRLDSGGSAEAVLELARILTEDGARVGLITGRTVDPQEDLNSFALKTGVQVFSVPQLVRNVSPVSDIIAFFRIRKLIRHFKPDIVHTHTSKAGIIGRFAAWSLRIRHIIHTPHGHIFYGYYNPLVTTFFTFMERIAAKVTAKITTLTESGRCDHIRLKIGPEHLFTVIPTGVKVKRFMEGNGSGVRIETGWQEMKIVGWVGRLVPIKDCITFIRAAALIRDRCENVRFLIVGDGEEREMLEQRVKALGLQEQCIFTGKRNDIPSVMAALDVFVLSSLNEGFGRVLIEAMAAGAVVVSTEVGGTKDVIEDGKSGILVPPSSPDRITDAVCRVLDDHELYGRLKKGGRERAQFFDVSSMAGKFEELYEDICCM